MPVQRIPRYELLLRELIRAQPPPSSYFNEFLLTPDGKQPTDQSSANSPQCFYAALLEKPLKKIQIIATHVNQQQKKLENMNKLVEIQRNIHGWEEEEGFPPNEDLVVPSRVLLLEGTLTKVSSAMMTKGKLKKSHAFLFNDMILWTNASGGYKKRFHMANLLGCSPLLNVQATALAQQGGGGGSISLNNSAPLSGLDKSSSSSSGNSSSSSSNTKSGFRIVCSDNTQMEWLTASPEEEKVWVDAVNEAMNQYKTQMEFRALNSSGSAVHHGHQPSQTPSSLANPVQGGGSGSKNNGTLRKKYLTLNKVDSSTLTKASADEIAASLASASNNNTSSSSATTTAASSTV